jgi:hypothetical protein
MALLQYKFIVNYEEQQGVYPADWCGLLLIYRSRLRRLPTQLQIVVDRD